MSALPTGRRMMRPASFRMDSVSSGLYRRQPDGLLRVRPGSISASMSITSRMRSMSCRQLGGDARRVRYVAPIGSAQASSFDPGSTTTAVPCHHAAGIFVGDWRPDAPRWSCMTMLIEIPDVLTPDELRQCRDLLQQASWHDGRQTGSYRRARQDNQQLAQDDPLAEQLSSFLLGRLGSVRRFVAAALPEILPPRFQPLRGPDPTAHISTTRSSACRARRCGCAAISRQLCSSAIPTNTTAAN